MSGLFKNKMILIGALLVVILGGGGYFFLGGGGGAGPTLTATDETTGETGVLLPANGEAVAAQAAASAAIERELIDELLNLKNIVLDRSALDTNAYRSLQDFSRPIDPEPVGRPNPFEPLGGYVATDADDN